MCSMVYDTNEFDISLSLFMVSIRMYWSAAIIHYPLFSAILFISTYETLPRSLIIYWIYSYFGLSLWFFSSTLPSIINLNYPSCRIMWLIHLLRLLTIFFHNNFLSDILFNTTSLVILYNQLILNILL